MWNTQPPRIVLLGDQQRAADQLDTIRRCVEQHGEIVGEHLGFEPLDELDADFGVVLGGDGSMLRAAKQIASHLLPVVGVNLGRLGFLAALSPEEMEDCLDRICRGDCLIVDHLMFHVELWVEDQLQDRCLGLNEMAILGGSPFSILDVHLHVDGNLATTYSCDGLIISTPIGSTAHSLSAGGPILEKSLQAFVLQPISPHTLTVRPVVDCADRVFEAHVPSPNAGTSVVVDGRVWAQNLTGDERIRLMRAPSAFRMIEMPGRSHYRTLRKNWGGADTSQNVRCSSTVAGPWSPDAAAAELTKLARVPAWRAKSPDVLPFGREIADNKDVAMAKNGLRFKTICVFATLICTFVSAAATAQDAASEGVTLRYRFKANEEVVTKVTHMATTKTKIRGHNQESKSHAVSSKLWRITGIDAKGNISFEHLVTDVEMWQKVTGRDEIRYNSRKDEKPPAQYEHAAKSIGKVICALTISPTGKILERKNNLPQHDMGLGPIATPLPEGPVQVGQRWTVPSEVSVRIKDQFKRIQTRKMFKLLNVKTGIATIEVKTQLLTPVDNPEIEAQIMQQLTNGTMKFDVEAGRVVSKRMDWDETVVGFNGADSMMEYLARFEEETTPTTTARRP